MTPFSVTKSTRRYRIVGLKSQRATLPLSTWAAWREAGLFGLPAGMLLALPVALRNEDPNTSGLLVWLAATGLLGLAVIASSGLLRMARPLPSSVGLVPLGVLFALGPLTFLGKVLHAQTHHRPLGAATFAVLSVFIILSCLALGGRVRATLASNDPGKRLFGKILLYTGLALSLVLGLRGFVAILGTAKTHSTYLASVLDGLLGISVSLVGGFLRFSPRIEQLARIAGPLAMAVCILSLLAALKDTHTSAALAHCLSLWAVLKPV
jgi:hypothetical protein